MKGLLLYALQDVGACPDPEVTGLGCVVQIHDQSMGHHYLPQRLLKGFAHEAQYVWMLDKRSFDQPRSLPIARVANEPGMYTEKLEGQLNNEIEQPFNAILDRLEQGQKLAAGDTEVIARYVLTMYRRGPKGRERSHRALPEVSQHVELEHLKHIDEMERFGGDPEVARIARQNVSQIHARFRNDPNQLWWDTLHPDMYPKLLAAFRKMKWAVCQTPPGRQLLMSDNPVMFDEIRGIRDEGTLLLFPIRSDALLIASWHPVAMRRILTVQQIRFVNECSAGWAQRWVFYQHNESWILPFVQKASDAACLRTSGAAWQNDRLPQ